VCSKKKCLATTEDDGGATPVLSKTARSRPYVYGAIEPAYEPFREGKHRRRQK